MKNLFIAFVLFFSANSFAQQCNSQYTAGDAWHVDLVGASNACSFTGPSQYEIEGRSNSEGSLGTFWNGREYPYSYGPTQETLKHRCIWKTTDPAGNQMLTRKVSSGALVTKPAKEWYRCQVKLPNNRSIHFNFSPNVRYTDLTVAFPTKPVSLTTKNFQSTSVTLYFRQLRSAPRDIGDLEEGDPQVQITEQPYVDTGIGGGIDFGN